MPIDFSIDKEREEIVEIMKEILEKENRIFNKELEKILDPVEVDIQKRITNLSFKEGSWFRPAHNIFVPLSMISICKYDNYSRDLVFVAQMHDIGNSLMEIAKTTKGADWENVDKRKKHMELGADLLTEWLSQYKALGKLGISKERIAELSEIVATHDNPYLGMPLKGGEEAKALRCADRTFIMMAGSFYKDLAAYLSDEKYLKKAEKFGVQLSPEEFLKFRLAFFYKNKEDLPEEWDTTLFPLEPDRAGYNEGGRYDEPYTRTGRKIVGELFKRRAKELENLSEIRTTLEFANLFEKGYSTDVNSLINLASR